MSRSHSLPLLESITIASPCSARWDQMTGDEKSRHCAQCNLRVHNLSAMTREEAAGLLASRDGICVRLYRRADGTVITQDCPVGIAAVRARVRRRIRRIAAAIGLVSAATAAGVETSRNQPVGTLKLRTLNPFASLAEWIAPAPPPTPITVTVTTGFALQGKMCITPPTPTVAPQPPAPSSP